MRIARWLRHVLEVLIGLAKIVLICGFCLWAYRIRLYAVETFGYLIHEFDPWFNFRATQYLAKHGWYKFFRWYDYMSWYPLGRPIGTTIYPGMQFVSVWIFQALRQIPKMEWKLPEELLDHFPAGAASYLPGHGKLSFGPMSLNNVCVMVPAWFGSVATLFVALLTAEASESTSAGVVAAFVMAIIPAHQTRSMAGEFDNESVAISAFCATFWLWCRSLRSPRSWPWGILAAAAYVCAVSTWGGYIFVNNLIGLHAATIVALGRYNTGVYRAYSLWYVLGTAGATFVPCVGWTPVRSIEQMPSLAVFLGYQLIALCDVYRHKKAKGMTPLSFFIFRTLVFVVVGLGVVVACFFMMQFNFFSPWTARIRGLFLKHEKTGNPLVDSVAEHQPSDAEAYEYSLGSPRFVAAIGLFLCWHQRTPAKFFPSLFAMVAYHFSLKMNRLILMCGPIVSMLAGYPVGIVADWCLEQLVALVCGPRVLGEATPEPSRTGGMGSILRTAWRTSKPLIYPVEVQKMAGASFWLRQRMPLLDSAARAILAIAILIAAIRQGSAPVREFIELCEESSSESANPSIVMLVEDHESGPFVVDDYLMGYRWIKKNTPANSRVLAWWDYGYQITGIANRTSLADGNTWNHEHIATLGRILSNPEKKAHNIMRHLADYVLVWAGERETDLLISQHFARIGNSVFPDICGAKDPTCRAFGFDDEGEPTPMMAESFVYRAVKHKLEEGVRLNPKLFKEVHSTRYGLMRIYQVLNVSLESKDWVADPANRLCDAPGSWYCVGQYPPALQSLIAKRKNFAQLEDFNKKGQEKSAYTKLVEQRQQLRENEL